MLEVLEVAEGLLEKSGRVLLAQALAVHGRRQLERGLRPGVERDVFDRMLDGRTATLERIYIDYDDRIHLAVTVDDDPGQDLMRETGRYLFFFPHEVQAL